MRGNGHRQAGNPGIEVRVDRGGCDPTPRAAPWTPERALAIEVIVAAFHDLLLPCRGKRETAAVIDAVEWLTAEGVQAHAIQWWCELTGLEVDSVRDQAAIIVEARRLTATPTPATVQAAMAPLVQRAAHVPNIVAKVREVLERDERVRWGELRLGLLQRRRVTCQWPVTASGTAA